MSDSRTDFYHHKTDTELLFFVEHPHYYQPSLVEAAKGELRRRGVSLTAPAAQVAPESSASQPYAPVSETGSSSKAAPVAVGAAVLLALGLGGFYLMKSPDRPATAIVTRVPPKFKAPPKLEEVPTNAIPNYDVAAAVAQQLRQIPASEKTNPQHLRQFRELTKRFWAAETQTEYLTIQAHAGKASPMFTDQALIVRESWRAWNQAAAYSYTFGPTMKTQLYRMGEAAGSQQHILDSLPGLLADQKYQTDKELNAREADVQDWLAALLPASPVTGKPYKATVLKVRM